MSKIVVGSKVAYSVQFLKSIGMSHSEMAAARGIVTEIKDSGSYQIAVVNWTNVEDMPGRINVKNLAIVGPNTRFCQC